MESPLVLYYCFSIILQLFQSFQRLGISKGKEGTLSSVDRLTRQFDKEIVDWKEEVEVNVFKICCFRNKRLILRIVCCS